MSMFSEIRWRFTVAVAAGLVLIAVHAFQWTIVDRISPFLYLPLVGAVWWIVVGAGLVSLTCFTKIRTRSEEHTSELQSLMRISYAVFCLKKKKEIYEGTNGRQKYYNTETTENTHHRRQI